MLFERTSLRKFPIHGNQVHSGKYLTFSIYDLNSDFPKLILGFRRFAVLSRRLLWLCLTQPSQGLFD